MAHPWDDKTDDTHLRNHVEHVEPLKALKGNSDGVSFTSTCGLVYHDAMALHRPHHPASDWEEEGGFPQDNPPPGAITTFAAACASSERPERITVCWDTLVKRGMTKVCQRLKVREATKEELLSCHTAEHVAAMLALQESNEGEEGKGGSNDKEEGGEEHEAKGPASGEVVSQLSILKEARRHNYVFMNRFSVRAARLAAGGVIDAALACGKGAALHGRGAACVVRPPGHHSESGCCMGFGLFNSVAVAAQCALDAGTANRVLIVDWDVHHGNGTQEMFYSRPDVMYVSLHRWDMGFFYPGAYFDAVGREQIGSPDSIGDGDGSGYNANVAWSNGLHGAKYGDLEYAYAFRRVVLPLARAFAPDLVLVSAGFDAARGDPEGELDVTPEGYAWMTAALMEHASRNVVVVLEGGYNVVSVARCMEACVATLLGVPPPQLDGEPCAEAKADVEKTVASLSPHWKQALRSVHAGGGGGGWN